MSDLVHISTRSRRIGSGPDTFSNPNPVFGELVSNLGAQLYSIATSGDGAITQAKMLARFISTLDAKIAELDMNSESKIRAALTTLSQELRFCIVDLESAVRDIRNNTIAFERMNLHRG